MKVCTYPFQSTEDELIGNILRERQGTIIYPTETYYALGCIATSNEAVARVYALKKRDRSLPLLVLINSWAMLDTYAAKITREQKTFLTKYWPGALTVILETRKKLAKELNMEGTTLGFRMTSSPIARRLIDLAGCPLVGTSANRSTEKEISYFKETTDVFGQHVDLYIDGGTTLGKRPSTLIEMTKSSEYSVIRQGAVQL